ncbi:MAG: lipoprotein-releasing ABC transporter permease subunit [Myxococcota bacterium]
MQVETIIGLRYLRSKKRSAFLSVITFISVAGVALGVATLVVVLSVMTGFEQDLKDKILGANAHGVVLKADDDFIEYRVVMKKAKEVKGVAAAAPFVLGEVMISAPLMTTGSILKGVNPDEVDEVIDLRKNLVEGKLEYLKNPAEIPAVSFFGDMMKQEGDEKETSEKEPDVFEEMEGKKEGEVKEEKKILPGIILGQELAKMLRAFVGDTIHLISPLGDGAIGPMGPVPKARAFRVAGIFFSGFYEYDAKLAYVNLKDAQDFLGMGDSVSGVEIKVGDIDEADKIMAAVHDALGGFPYRTRDWQQMNRNLFSALKLEKLVMFIILIFIVLVASFNIVSALYMFVTEKEKEIAIIKSIGADNGMVSRVFSRIGLIIGGIGTVLGLLAGYALCVFIELHGIRLDPDVYYIEKLPVVMDTLEFIVIAVSAVAISFLATLPPSYLASRLRPVEGLRYD